MKKIILLIFVLLVNISVKAQAESFKWLREARYPVINGYSEGKAAFMQNGRWGFLDTNGEIFIPAIYDGVRSYKNDFVIVQQGDKYGVIDKEGNVIFQPEFTALSDFDSGIALGKIDDISYFVYANGKKQALSSEYIYHPYSEGYARVQKKDKWGYIDTKGNMVIDTRYSFATDFSEGHAFVFRKDEAFCINKKGSRKAITFELDTLASFKEGRAKVPTRNLFTYVKIDDLNYIPYRFKHAEEFSEGLACVTFMDDTKGYISPLGNRVISLSESVEHFSFSDGLARVKYNGKYGYINKTGELIIDTIFASASDFNDGMALVTYKGRPGIIKKKEMTDKTVSAEIAHILLADENKNGRIEAEEAFSVAVTIKNTGDEAVKDIDVRLMGNGMLFDELEMKERHYNFAKLEAKQDTTIHFTGKAGIAVNSQDIKFDVMLSADNLFLADVRNRQYQIVGIKNSKPLLHKFWVFKDNHSILKEGDQANVKINVLNDGEDIAKNVKIAIFWPEGTIGERDSLFIPEIAPRQTKEIVTTFTMDSTLIEKKFTIVASLTEHTGTKKDIKYMPFESGCMNVETELYATSQTRVQDQIETGKPVMRPSELLEGLEQINPFNENRYALIIGNEGYSANKQTVSSEQDVDYARQDAEVFAAYAKNVLGVPESNIILLKDATFAQMNFNINKLCMISKTNPGIAELIVYYAGHGQHDVNTKETYLIPVDVSIAAPSSGIKLEGMYAQLSSCEAKRTMVFLDACYSGVGRGIVIKPKETPVKGNMVVMTASSSTQRSMPYEDKKHGMFTYHLLKTLKETNGNITFTDLYSTVKQDVQKNSIWINNVEQTPELLQGEDIQPEWETWTVY